METARFTPYQMQDLAVANAAAEIFTNLYAINHRVEFVWDLTDELFRGSDESKAIASELEVEALWQNLADGVEPIPDEYLEDSNARMKYLSQAIGLVTMFGEFAVLIEY